MPESKVKNFPLSAVLVATWLLCVASGLAALGHYGAQAGEAAPAPRTWPEQETELASAPGKPRLVFFAHPKCPCTRASLSELARLLTRAGGDASVEVAFYRPASEPDAWAHTSLWDQAARIPGVTLRTDPAGVESKRFGAGTSGHVVCYDAQGTLRYSGGLTLSRGHEGDSAYTDSLAKILQGEVSELDRAPTYGCSIRGASDLAACTSASCPEPRLAE